MTPPTDTSSALERFVERTRRVTTRLASADASAVDGRLRPTAVGGVLVVLASVAISLAAAPALGDSVRIRWSIGTYYGPEYAPTSLALAVFPILVAVIDVGLRTLAWGLERSGAFDTSDGVVRLIYEGCALATLLTVVAVQVLFVVANLL